MSAQDDIHEAFQWARHVYEEGRVLLDDVAKIAADIGLRPWEGLPWTSYTTVLRAGEFPFVYLGAVMCSPEATWDKDAGTSVFWAIDFHSDVRRGPYLLAGTVQYSTEKEVGAPLLNETARKLGGRGYFKTKKPAPPAVAFVHTPSGEYKGFAGVEEVRHVEFPLTRIDTPELLRKVVVGTAALLDGDEGPLRELVEMLKMPAVSRGERAPTGAGQ